MRFRDIVWPDLRAILPAGKSGGAEVVHDFVDEKSAKLANLIQASKRELREEYLFIEPGPITKLMINGTLFMSDARMEKITSAELVVKGHGRVLVAGLGLGLVLHPLAAKAGVWITVVECSRDVIKLVGPSVPKGVDVVRGDIFKIPPAYLIARAGGKFDSIFFDIWPTIDQVNLPAMAKLHRRFSCARNMDNPKSWMTSWMYDYLRKSRRRVKRRCELTLAPMGGSVGSSFTCRMRDYV